MKYIAAGKDLLISGNLKFYDPLVSVYISSSTTTRQGLYQNIVNLFFLWRFRCIVLDCAKANVLSLFLS